MTTLASIGAHGARVLRVAVIGAETAGSLGQLLRTLPERSGLALAAVCRTAAPLAMDSLRSSSALPITEVRDRTGIEPDQVLLVPPGSEAAFQRDELVVRQVGEPRAPLDKLLRSLAREYGSRGVCVLLDRGCDDGKLGLKSLREAGGLTIARAPDGGDGGDGGDAGERDEAPRRAAPGGTADLVLPLSAIADRLAAFGRPDEDPADGDAVAEDTGCRAADPLAERLHDILALLRSGTGHDFSPYRQAMLYRRMQRRMQVCRCGSLAAYHRHLRERPGELAHLVRDLWISVTDFFRDREAFEVLAGAAIPRLFEGKRPEDQVRVWVAGCATGEEAYSVAMLLCEHAAALHRPPRLRIFATDVDDDALAEARAGRYPATIAVDVSPERLERFFRPDGDHLRVAGELREIATFVHHDVLRDPPFSRLDLIVCRNLLTHLDRAARDGVLRRFHFGLVPDGFLLLGTSESPEPTAVFAGADAEHRLFVRRPGAPRLCGGAAAGAPPAIDDELGVRAEQQLRAALCTAPLLVVTLDHELRVTWAYVLGEELGPGDGAARLAELFAPGGAERFAEHARRARSDGRGQRVELDLALGGERRTYDVRIEPRALGLAAVGFDITPSKLAQAALIEADRRKDEFLATLSHELRNPLTPLKVALDVAKLAAGDPVQLERTRGIMERQVAQLTQLVDDLLDLSRIAQGKLQLECVPVDPRQAIDAAVEATRPLFQQRRHQLTVELPGEACSVLGDPARLTQVLTNLLNNAAKYTPPGGHVVLTLAVDPPSGRLAIRVRDDGDGIVPDLLPRIFEIFVQSRGPSHHAQTGLGIGLNLVQRLVELHGGHVSASSDGPGRGSEFTVELPIIEMYGAMDGAMDGAMNGAMDGAMNGAMDGADARES